MTLTLSTHTNCHCNLWLVSVRGVLCGVRVCWCAGSVVMHLSLYPQTRLLWARECAHDVDGRDVDMHVELDADAILWALRDLHMNGVRLQTRLCSAPTQPRPVGTARSGTLGEHMGVMLKSSG